MLDTGKVVVKFVGIAMVQTCNKDETEKDKEEGRRRDERRDNKQKQKKRWASHPRATRSNEELLG